MIACVTGVFSRATHGKCHMQRINYVTVGHTDVASLQSLSPVKLQSLKGKVGEVIETYDERRHRRESGKQPAVTGAFFQ